MFPADQYQLLDFGDGRKLERLGDVILDRPSPPAAGIARRTETLWKKAAARFIPQNDAARGGCGTRGRWEKQTELAASWTVEHARSRFELRLTEFGHVGVFPEQAENWDWISQQVSHISSKLPNTGDSLGPRLRVLNLFAYTGGSTLAAAAAGAEVVHVDAARSTVGWARRNAELSGLAAAPIRWIVEDAARFVAREQKRGNRYHGIILDPPSYGHGPKGRSWQIERDLPALLADCSALLVEQNGFLVLTCHSPDVGPSDLREQIERNIRAANTRNVEGHDLFLIADDGRQLHSGVAALWASR